MLEQTIRDPLFWKYASIPFIAAFVGWATNWIAIRMTFRPLEFVGLRPVFGWQGIIPSKAAKMAGIFVDKTMYRLGSLSEFFREMEPHRIADQITEVIEPRLEEYTDEILLAQHPALWENLPTAVRSQVYARVHNSLPKLVDNLMSDVAERVEELVDLKEMLTRKLVGDKAVLNRLFLESGAKEFRFIIRSGAYFGFLFGLIQLAVWIVHPAWWVLPVFGLFVGWATNWFALNIIFRPLQPRRIGPWTLQGLFLKRQKEVAAVWCRLVTREIMTVRTIIHAMLFGSRAALSKRLIQRHIRPIVDEAVGLVKTVAQIAVGLEGYAELKESVGRKAIDVSTQPFDDPMFNEQRAQVVERLLRERMEGLPADQFQDLLRPCFQEDEMKLIVLGGVLGFLAGLAQLFFIFGGAG